MELVLTTEDLEPLLKQQKDLITEPSGFLNSEYKSTVNESLNNVSSKSIFGIRQRIKSSQYKMTSSIETAIKVSIFTCVILAVFS